MDYSAIEQLATQGETAWLEQQFPSSPGLHEPIVNELLRRQTAGAFAAIEQARNNSQFAFRRLAWWQQAVPSCPWAFSG